jgi:hypothetical protein
LVANDGWVAGPVKAVSRRRRGPQASLYRACHPAIPGHRGRRLATAQPGVSKPGRSTPGGIRFTAQPLTALQKNINFAPESSYTLHGEILTAVVAHLPLAGSPALMSGNSPHTPEDRALARRYHFLGLPSEKLDGGLSFAALRAELGDDNAGSLVTQLGVLAKAHNLEQLGIPLHHAVDRILQSLTADSAGQLRKVAQSRPAWRL